MSYNGVGLQSVRGSGTSGYVQRNMSLPKPQRHDRQRDLIAPEPAYKKPNADIMEHAAKRAVEVKLMELRLLMEEQGYGESEIVDKIAEARAALLQAGAPPSDAGSVHASASSGTHGLSALKQAEDSRLRGAFGISSDYKEGAAFDEEVQAQRREDARAAREAANAKWEAEAAARAQARAAREADRATREAARRPLGAPRGSGSGGDAPGAASELRRRDRSRSRSLPDARGARGGAGSSRGRRDARYSRDRHSSSPGRSRSPASPPRASAVGAGGADRRQVRGRQRSGSMSRSRSPPAAAAAASRSRAADLSRRRHSASASRSSSSSFSSLGSRRSGRRSSSHARSPASPPDRRHRRSSRSRSPASLRRGAGSSTRRGER
jgi:serine/arginine repetitive matrix protein 2